MWDENLTISQQIALFSYPLNDEFICGNISYLSLTPKSRGSSYPSSSTPFY